MDEIEVKKSKYVSKSTAYKIYWWCISEYGRSKLNGPYPYLEFKKLDDYSKDDYGYYDEVEKVIFINKNLHNTLEELVKTIIHEYTHYVKHSMHEYKILAKYLSHHRNPLEVDARRIERRDYKKCLKFLKEEYKIIDKV
jgi:hypothetical protein